MNVRFSRYTGRRQFLKQSGFGALALSGFAVVPVAERLAQGTEDPPNVHNMLVVGQTTVFLSHLPMFDSLDGTKTAFRSPHRFQVILEAMFTKDGKDVTSIYVNDRRANPKTRIYTLSPERFVLSQLFTPSEAPRLTSFNATVFRGHLEQGGKPIRGLEKTRVTVTRRVHARQFEPQVKKPEQLTYILFGRESELYLAHGIFAPPDFDHVLSVTLSGHTLTKQELNAGVQVVFPDRKNVAAARLRQAEKAAATLLIGGGKGSAISKAELRADVEFYFEEGELLVPPTFDPTPEEKKG